MQVETIEEYTITVLLYCENFRKLLSIVSDNIPLGMAMECYLLSRNVNVLLWKPTLACPNFN